MTRMVAVNRRARRNYDIGDTYEAGLVLQGTEVKTLRQGEVSLAEAYGEPRDGELWLVNAHIGPYAHASRAQQHDPRRPRKLLLNRREARKITASIQQLGMTVIPLSIYFNDSGIAKTEIALGRGRKIHDRRDAVKKRDWERERARILRARG